MTGRRSANADQIGVRGPMLLAMSRVAHAFWPRFYRAIALLDPFTRPVWRRFGIGNIVEVVIPGRHTGQPRTLFLGLLRGDGRTYVGHPDGDCAWTRNLDAAGGGEIVFHDGQRQPFRAVPLPPGDERDAAIRLTFRQHPFPGMVLYWLSRRHVRAAGRYYRLSGTARDTPDGSRYVEPATDGA
jgi:hypothetical protein